MYAAIPVYYPFRHRGAARALSCVGHCEINKYADRDY